MMALGVGTVERDNTGAAGSGEDGLGVGQASAEVPADMGGGCWLCVRISSQMLGCYAG